MLSLPETGPPMRCCCLAGRQAEGWAKRSTRILAAGHVFVQNLRRGHYDAGADVPAATGYGKPSTTS